MLNVPGVQRGDCFRASIASILELPIEDVPHFVAIEGDWWGAVQGWLAERGLSAMWIRLNPEEVNFGWPCARTFGIITGNSPRGGGIKHSVVGVVEDGWNFTVAYDPHPSGAGIDGPAESVVVFLAMNPERSKANNPPCPPIASSAAPSPCYTSAPTPKSS